MAGEPLNFEKYFLVDHQVGVGVHLEDNKFFEDGATVKSIQGDLVQLELFGKGLPLGVTTEAGAKVVITSKETWALCRCHAILEKRVVGREMNLKLIGQVDVQQLRQYFRMDVSIPVLYSIPADQQLNVVYEEWKAKKLSGRTTITSPVMATCKEGFKVVGWKNGNDVEPCSVNLSGGGLRFKMAESLPPEALVHLEIFLPLIPARVIYAVGSVIRTNEVQLTWGKETYYSTAMEFKFIDEKDRETIISYIFNEQRNDLQQKAGRRI